MRLQKCFVDHNLTFHQQRVGKVIRQKKFDSDSDWVDHDQIFIFGLIYPLKANKETLILLLGVY